jgi:hypothetical protein
MAHYHLPVAEIDVLDPKLRTLWQAQASPIRLENGDAG